jgi:hypothetical protein
MRPQQLSPGSFSAYPPQARKLAVGYLASLRLVPLSLLPTLLRDVKEYDWKFPREQTEIVARLDFLKRPQAQAPLAAFTAFNVPDTLADSRWVDQPVQFIEQLTAYLWSSRQMDAYRQAAAEFVRQFQTLAPPAANASPRFVTILIGRDARPPAYPLFHKLSLHGQILTCVDAVSAARAILAQLAHRAQAAPEEYSHWYLDGGSPLSPSTPPGVTQLTYPAVVPVNQRILDRMNEAIRSGTGPEVLRSALAQLSPAELSADLATADPRLQHLIVSLLTEASGTQIFSTSFVQWASREVLRRVQPMTLCARYAPRQRQQAFNAMVRAASHAAEMDPEGSLIDADMGAYYTYLEMKKLPGAESATFIVCLEGGSQAFVAGPGIPPGTRSDSPNTLTQLLNPQARTKS